MKRKKVDWLKEIEDMGLLDNFNSFVADNDLKQHTKGKKILSRNRLACAYIRHITHLVRSVKLF